MQFLLFLQKSSFATIDSFPTHAMAARKETIRFLKRQIEGKMVQSESLHSFFPELFLEVIFNLDDVRKAVDELECPVIEKTGLAHTIHKKGTRVFAILIKNGEEDLITEFRKNEVLDAQLPLSEAVAKQIAGDFGISFARDYQRQFLPYKFSRDMRDYHRRINNSERILPFVGEPAFIAEGGFGDISKVMIFNSQQEFVLNEVRSRPSLFVIGIAIQAWYRWKGESHPSTDVLTEWPNSSSEERN